MNKRENNIAGTLPTRSEKGKAKKIMEVIGKGVLPVIVLAVGVYATVYLFSSSPKAKRLPKKKNLPIVQTVQGTFGNHPTLISAMGTVKPSQEIDFKPQVSGVVISLGPNMLPGGHFSRGDILMQLDPQDYELAFRQQKNGVIQAQNNLEIEQGNQIVAARELELLGEQVTESEKRLMLRGPQLQTLENELEIAQAKLDQARLDLERTTLKAPFNGIVQTREVNIGSWVSTASTVATLVGTDSFWVEVSIPEEQLQWVHIPSGNGDVGSTVRIYNPSSWGSDRYRTGQVVQLLPTLETQGRMARLLIEVEDPMSLREGNESQPKVLIGSFVRVSIEGKIVENVMILTRDYLRNGNTLWVYEPDGTLGIREVNIVFKNQDIVLVNGAISEKDELVVSSLSTPIAGMKLAKVNEQQKEDAIMQVAVKGEGICSEGELKEKGGS